MFQLTSLAVLCVPVILIKETGLGVNINICHDLKKLCFNVFFIF